MKYEVSNIIFKAKPSGDDMKRKYPFKRGKEEVHLVDDTPYNLYLTYRRGFSFKPHPFHEVQGTLYNTRVQTIVLDFDHLTTLQKDFVQSIVDGKYQFSDVYGDYSAGTKTRLHENKDIPNYVNPKWGYKVFFPVDCLCTWSELNREFTRAVAFFNPIFPMDEVERIWAKWLKANNRKGVNGVDNPIFKNWILPDVAMLNSFRTQITYGVRPELKKDYIVKEEEEWPRKNSIYGSETFQCGGKQDYSGLEWKADEIYADQTSSSSKEFSTILKSWTVKILNSAWNVEFAEAMKWATARDSSKVVLSIPTSKSQVARLLNRSRFDDLVWDDGMNSLLSAIVWQKHGRDSGSEPFSKRKVNDVSRDAARTLTRNLIEIERQKNPSTSCEDAVKSNIHLLLHDILCVVLLGCGFDRLVWIKDQKNGPSMIDGMKRTVFRHIVLAMLNFSKFTMRMRMRNFQVVCFANNHDGFSLAKQPHLDTLRKFAETKNKAYLADYMRQRSEWMKENEDVLNNHMMPYVHVKRGLKKWLISTATLDVSNGLEDIDIDSLMEPARIESEEEWIEWCRNGPMKVNGRRNDEVSDNDLRKWFKDYRREYNRKFCKDEVARMVYGGKIQKQHRKSKYDREFKDKTPEQISDLISKMDISKQKKWYLRNTYVIKTC